jgi:hypothetical protein
MKVRMHHVQPREMVSLGNERVRLEIQSFLKALDSYPDRFAKEPKVSFEQHLWSLVNGKADPRSQN